jgi:hypothetical protein
MIEAGEDRTVLSTHRHVATHNGHEIWQRQPGFEFTPVMLGKIASYIARAPDGRYTVFAFMYSMLASLEGAKLQEDRLLDEAIRVIEQTIDQMDTTPQQDHTFEYHDAAWLEVRDPQWWISTR